MNSALVIFAGLLVTAIAICGTVDARAPLTASESRVLNLENVVGPAPVEIIGTCNPAEKGGDEQCRRKHVDARAVAPVSFNH